MVKKQWNEDTWGVEPMSAFGQLRNLAGGPAEGALLASFSISFNDRFPQFRPQKPPFRIVQQPRHRR